MLVLYQCIKMMIKSVRMKFAHQNVYAFAPNCSITLNTYDILAPQNIPPNNIVYF